MPHAVDGSSLMILIDERTPLMATRATAVPEQGSFTAVVKRDGRWWIGWVEEIPGVNSQGRTRDELIENLRSELSEALEMNRAAAVADVTGDFEEVRINPGSDARFSNTSAPRAAS
jgi:predicted RNase H-like HicB family nuclease